MMQKPDVDQIDGLSPAISIEQKTTSRNPRSTVGTVTEIYDYLRLLYARIGSLFARTGLPIESQTVSQMVDRLMALDGGTRFIYWRPLSAVARANISATLPSCKTRLPARQSRWQLLRNHGSAALDKKLKHDIDVVVDRWLSKTTSATAWLTVSKCAWADRWHCRCGNGGYQI